MPGSVMMVAGWSYQQDFIAQAAQGLAGLCAE